MAQQFSLHIVPMLNADPKVLRINLQTGKTTMLLPHGVWLPVSEPSKP